MIRQQRGKDQNHAEKLCMFNADVAQDFGHFRRADTGNKQRVIRAIRLPSGVRLFRWHVPAERLCPRQPCLGRGGRYSGRRHSRVGNSRARRRIGRRRAWGSHRNGRWYRKRRDRHRQHRDRRAGISKLRRRLSANRRASIPKLRQWISTGAGADLRTGLDAIQWRLLSGGSLTLISGC
jgi:hypothetical protein